MKPGDLAMIRPAYSSEPGSGFLAIILSESEFEDCWDILTEHGVFAIYKSSLMAIQ
jgi:hypothetical protein